MASSSSSLSGNWEHSVFPSFHGPDVRHSFLSHVLREFKSKGISQFIDNNIKRGEYIGPELKRAIRGSKILIVLFSRRYASSSWCLDELVEIMNKKLGQTVMTIFYHLDPTDVKKQTGYFGEVFKNTCIGKTEEKTETWKKALEGVATIAGYHINKGVDEAAMIENISVEISNRLNIVTPSRDFGCLIGMEAHMERMKPLLRLELNEVRMIGIWGPPGIGKSTIARCLFNQFSNSFQLRLLMVDIKENYPKTCLNEESEQLKLQRKMLSKMLNHKVKEITNLGVARVRLKDMKVFLVLDEVDSSAQLEALAGGKQWFGRGSRIIIISENQRLLNAQGVDHIYEVGFPTTSEALQMFCMHAFGQTTPKDGFMTLAHEVTNLVKNLPLGLKVKGSHFKGMPKEEWGMELPRLTNRLDGRIGSVLKFSYDALDNEEKYLFLHIACLFSYGKFESLVTYLEKRFPNVRQQLVVFSKKSLISIEDGYVEMHALLCQLGRDIVRDQSTEPRQRQFLTDYDGDDDIKEVLNNDDAAEGIIRSVTGLTMYSWEPFITGRARYGTGGEMDINGRAFEGMQNLERRLSHGPSYLSPKLRLLHWTYFPMTRLPSPVNLEFLVELNLPDSNLEKLWEGNKSIRNLIRMDLSYSIMLKELPNLSTATSLEIINLKGCSSLVKLPSSIGNATNLQKVNLKGCSSLVKLPSSIGNATNLQVVNLKGCSRLVAMPFSIGNAIMNCSIVEDKKTSFRTEASVYLDFQGYSSLLQIPSFIGNAINLDGLDFSGCSSAVEVPASIGNLHELDFLIFRGCSKLEVLPVNVNLESLDKLDLSGCSSLQTFPEISANIRYLDLSGTAIEEVPSSIKTWYLCELILKGCSKLEFLPVNVHLESLERLDLSGCSSLKTFPEISTNIRELDLSGTAIEEVPSSIRTWYRLHKLILKGCKNLLSISQLPKSLGELKAVNCESLERLDFSFSNSYTNFNFANCFKLNKDARDLIIQSSTAYISAHVLPGKEIPIYFTHRADGDRLVLKLNERPFPYKLKFKACILLVSKNDTEDSDEENAVEDSDEENDVEDSDEENDNEDGDEENDVYDSGEDNGYDVEDSGEDNGYDVEDSDEENDVEDSDEENDNEDGDEENDVYDSGEDNGYDVEDSGEDNGYDVEDSGEDNCFEVAHVSVKIKDKQDRIRDRCIPHCNYLRNSLSEHLYIFEFEACVLTQEDFIEFYWGDRKELVIKECGVKYEDCDEENTVEDGSEAVEDGEAVPS